MNFSNALIQQLIAFRKDLHKNPELSNREYNTVKRISDFILTGSPDKIIHHIGYTGLAVTFSGEEKGPVILIRADIDALPITEKNDFEYKSVNYKVAHLCGHDGHTAILAGLARVLDLHPLKKGKVILLFQPAEETGEGAQKILNDPKFIELTPDYVFALHNLPGFDKNHIVVRNQHFTAASKGIIVKLFGKTSHAAHPEHGLSPALAVAEIIKKLSGLSQQKEHFKDFKLITIVHSRLGEMAFGITPGYAEIMATLRSYRNDDMDYLTSQTVEIIEKITDNYGLDEKIEWLEEFPATINNDHCVDMICEVAEENNLQTQQIKEPLRWSEDFGYFTKKFPGALFGVGAGTDHPGLHHADYDFSDDIIPAGVRMFDGIIRKITNK